MSVISAKKRVIGLTSAETEEGEEEDIPAPDPDLAPHPIPGEEAEENTGEGEDPILPPVDPPLTPETESTGEEEEDPTPPEEALALLTVKRTAEAPDLAPRLLINLAILEVVPNSQEVGLRLPEGPTEATNQEEAEKATIQAARTQGPRVLRRWTEAEVDHPRRETDPPPSHQRSLIK